MAEKDKQATLEDVLAELKKLQAKTAEQDKAIAAKDAELTAAKKEADQRLRAAAAARDGDKDEAIVELEAALAAKDVELEAAKAAIPGSTEISRARQLAQNNEQRNKLRASLMMRTFHKHGRAFYNSGDVPTYQGGHYIEARTTFAVPDDTIPSVQWLPVDSKGKVLGEADESEFVDTSPVPSQRAADRP